MTSSMTGPSVQKRAIMLMCMMVRSLLLGVGVIPILSAATANAQSFPLTYWQHSQWIGENGPPSSGSMDIRRSMDGYLWIGGTNRLIRFDGIRFSTFDSTNTPALRSLPNGPFSPHILGRNGLLWIYGPGGSLFTYANGVIRRVLAPGKEGNLAEDGAGRLWYSTDQGIYRLVNDKLVASSLPAGTPLSDIFGLERDTADGLWVGTFRDGLVHVHNGRVEKLGTGRMRVLLQSRDGTVWAIGEGVAEAASGLARFVDGKWLRVELAGTPRRGVLSRIAVEGPDGSVWFVTPSMGLLRWFNGQIEQFSTREGLSSNRVQNVYADAEGSVWVTTDAGLDRLRPALFASIETRHGLPTVGGELFAEDSSGAIWITSLGSAFLLDNGIVRNRTGPITSTNLRISSNATGQLIAPSHFGGIWVGPSEGGVYRLLPRGSETQRVRKGFPDQRIGTALEASDGTLWTMSLTGVLGSFRNGRYKRASIDTVASQSGHVFAEDNSGRMWFASAQNRITWYARDSIVSEFDLEPGRAAIKGIATESGDTAWASTFTSLIRITGKRSVEIKPPGLERMLGARVQLVISGGWLWLSSSSGFARLPLSELHRMADGQRRDVPIEIFGPLDGLAVPHTPSQVPTTIRVGRDGRVWVATPNGLAVASPDFRMTIKHPRRILIEELTVGDSAISVAADTRIPPSPSRISIRFSVPSTLLAERVRMQYRLDGADDAWVDATVPRVATYNQLRPGNYSFRVRAWDETGQPVPGEATLSFRVMPTWYQSWWFFTLLSAVGAAVIVLIYRMRVRQITQAYNVRLEERAAERTRIARELHDTLLQSFQGLMFRLQAVREMLPAQSAKAIPVLDTALQKGEEAIDQARSAVGDLRSPESVERDFETGVAAIVRDAIHICGSGDAPSWEVNSRGRIREIPPVVLYELYQVVQEALCNIFRHAQASNVSIELRYSFDYLHVTINDDGVGFDESLLSSQRRRGHFGLQGMIERVEQLGGEMSIRSRPRDGTHATLAIPAAVAYRKTTPNHSFSNFLTRRKRSRTIEHD